MCLRLRLTEAKAMRRVKFLARQAAGRAAYAAESNVSLGEADFLALRPCRYAAEDQRVVDLDLQLHERAAATNAWRRANARRLGLKRYTESMLMNAYRAYYSLRQVGKLVRVHEASRRDRYTHVVAARPDCTIVSRFVWSDPPVRAPSA